MNKTPLYQAHLDAGARILPFAGWEMPIQYEGIMKEHEWTRTRASIFDICHMGEYLLEGPSAEADLNRLVTQKLSTLAEGQCRYGYLLNESGGVIDDLTVYRKGPESWFLVVNAGNRDRNAAWIQDHCSGPTEFSDLSDSLAKLDVQGPAAREILEAVTGDPMPSLGYFRFIEQDWQGMPTLISRTGYTGEFGYELYFPAGDAVRIWALLLQHEDLKPAGLGARDTLRLEVGYPLHGHELSDTRTPVGAGRGMFMDTSKSFIGCEAVQRELEQGAPAYLAGLALEGKRAAREGDEVTHEGRPVGTVTSGSLGPSVGHAVAMAYLPDSLTKPGTSLNVLIRGKEHPATVVDMPFYKKGTARRKG